MKPTILEIKLSELIIDPTLSGRTKKEISENAKELAPKMQAFQSWDATQPGAIFYRDKKPHLARGFTRVAAAEIAGLTSGFFMEVPDDTASLRTEAIRSNTGKPISAREQGRIYVAMRDGNAETATKGETVLAPMATAEIAKEVGYSRQWIDQCIGIYEETPEIAELIESDLVTSGAINRARQIAKKEDKSPDDAGRLRMLKAAIKAAQADGRPRAAEDDVNAVRSEYFPIKSDAPKRGKPEKKKKDEPMITPEREDEQPDQDAADASSAAPGELFSEPDKSVTPAPSKKVVKQAREIAGAVFEQCFADKTLADFDSYLAAVNAAGVQFTLSAL